jgi:hypothetical protein
MRERKATAKPERKKMAVEVDAELRQRLRVYAAQQDVKIRAVLSSALDEYLKKRGA